MKMNRQIIVYYDEDEHWHRKFKCHYCEIPDRHPEKCSSNPTTSEQAYEGTVYRKNRYSASGMCSFDAHHTDNINFKSRPSLVQVNGALEFIGPRILCKQR